MSNFAFTGETFSQAGGAMDASAAQGLSPKWDGYETFTIEETTSILRISTWKAYEMARNGNFPCIFFGRRRVVPRVALEKLLGYR